VPRKRKAPSSLATLTRRRHARKKNPTPPPPRRPAPRRNAALVGNPPFWQDVWNELLPATIGYSATRIAGRIGFKLAKRRSLTWARHVGPWTSVATAGIGWWAIHRNPEWEKRYHSGVIGAMIAALQGLLQSYLPQWGWILNDYHLDDQMQLGPGAAPGTAPAGANGQRQVGPNAQGQYLEAAHPQAVEDDLNEVLNEGESADDLYTGIFSA
jgi:hypothetical protein